MLLKEMKIFTYSYLLRVSLIILLKIKKIIIFGGQLFQQAAAHEQLGKQLCEEILTRPEERYVPCLAKALSQLEITPESTIFTQQEFSEYLNQIELVSFLLGTIFKLSMNELKALI